VSVFALNLISFIVSLTFVVVSIGHGEYVAALVPGTICLILVGVMWWGAYAIKREDNGSEF
jgi:hypothetical protein